MKKTTKMLLALSLVLILSMAAAGAVLAEEAVLEGTITFISSEVPYMMFVDAAEGSVTVFLTADFDFTPYLIGDHIALTGEWTGVDSFVATGLYVPPSDDDTGDDDDGGVVNENKAYCSDKKDTAHPVAAGIAATYGVPEEEIMALVCQGYSVGQIMLAFQTREMNGADPAETLARRTAGEGWGQIWKDAGLIGDADEGLPPGQAKKLDDGEIEHGQGKDKDKKDNPGNGGTPPGQDKKINP